VRGPARVAEHGGKGEIGLWSGQGRGKRQNRKTEDGTGQGYRRGKEERFMLRFRISEHMITLEQVTRINHGHNQVLRIQRLGFPTVMERGFLRRRGADVDRKGILGSLILTRTQEIRFLITSPNFQITCRCLD